ncbi:Kelch repeat-containing protein [Pelagibacterium montanilacus]|uniref:Kelch repeat-containing protein n=1 Tax=Pelagibacterium montanilacus TaxID=2185280 RepID=UPI000F8E5719|nr:kelch repeat-containing protein [Pelagibacterium montanilacus]
MTERPNRDHLPRIEGDWQTSAPLPKARSEITATYLDGRIYSFGGVHKGYTVDNAEVFDIKSETWQPIRPLPVPLDHTMAVAVADKIYILGGSLSATNEISGDSVEEMMAVTNWDFAPRTAVYCYDPALDRYERLGPMPLARLGHSAVRMGRHIYSVGGQGPNPSVMLRYDVDADRWDFLPGMPSFREHQAIAAMDGRIYVVGGRWPDPLDPEATFMIGQVNTGANEVYDPGSMSWGTLAPLPTPRGAGYGAVLDDLFYVAGGEVLDSPGRLTFGEVEAFDRNTNSWLVAPDLPTPRHGLAVVSDEDRLFVIGGGPKAAWDQTDVVEIFTPRNRRTAP